MKRGILIALLSAAAGGLTAYAVVNTMTKNQILDAPATDMAEFSTVNLAHEQWPEVTYAAVSAVEPDV